MKNLILIFLLFFSFLCVAQSVEGVWETYDDDSGELKSEVKLYIKDGKLYGKILELHNTEHGLENPKCIKCPGDKKNKRVIDMIILTGLTKDGEEWSGDEAILDPNNGEVYDCTIWLENKNELAVRGYSGWFYRTQYWKRVE
ncbi:MAG: DUF2147 domain-containing protein [Brumimicrobium sp.]